MTNSFGIWYNINSIKPNISRWLTPIERKMAMQTRVAVISIIIEDGSAVESINAILHDYSEFIIGRMGVPYRTKKVSIISIAIDAPQDRINTLAGRIGRLNGVTAKTVYSAV